MKKLRFAIEKNYVGGVSDVAYLDDDEDLIEGLVKAVIQDLHTDIELTIGGVTMHMAAWEDPDHWSSDWAKKLGIEFEDAADAVVALLLGAIESGD